MTRFTFFTLAVLGISTASVGIPDSRAGDMAEFYCKEKKGKDGSVEQPAYFSGGSFCGEDINANPYLKTPDASKDGVCIQNVLCTWVLPDDRKLTGLDALASLSRKDREWLPSMVVCRGKTLKQGSSSSALTSSAPLLAGQCPPPDECKSDTFFSALPGIGKPKSLRAKAVQWAPKESKPPTGEQPSSQVEP